MASEVQSLFLTSAVSLEPLEGAVFLLLLSLPSSLVSRPWLPKGLLRSQPLSPFLHLPEDTCLACSVVALGLGELGPGVATAHTHSHAALTFAIPGSAGCRAELLSGKDEPHQQRAASWQRSEPFCRKEPAGPPLPTAASGISVSLWRGAKKSCSLQMAGLPLSQKGCNVYPFYSHPARVRRTRVLARTSGKGFQE